MCVCATYVCRYPWRLGLNYQLPCSWSYKWPWATQCGSGNQTWVLCRSANALNFWVRVLPNKETKRGCYKSPQALTSAKPKSQGSRPAFADPRLLLTLLSFLQEPSTAVTVRDAATLSSSGYLKVQPKRKVKSELERWFSGIEHGLLSQKTYTQTKYEYKMK